MSFSKKRMVSLFTLCLVVNVILLLIYTAYINSDGTKGALELNTNENLETFFLPKRGENNIFFIETSCAANESSLTNNASRLLLTPQQACAIESAARTHPSASIYLLYTCPLDSGSIARSSKMLRQILYDYNNVYIWNQNMSSMFDGTPLEGFHKNCTLKTSWFPCAHSADVLRLLTLWKYGGTYLDLDFIVLRSLAPFGSNYACAEVADYVANGAMSFTSEGVGKVILDMCIEELRTNFRGDQWNHNGPALISRVLRKHCGVNGTREMTRENCNGFAVLPSFVFYPIIYDWKLFYNETLQSSTMAKIKKGHAVHLWNSLMSWEGGGELHMGSKQPIVQLQQEHCPVVYRHIPYNATDLQTRI